MLRTRIREMKTSERNKAVEICSLCQDWRCETCEITIVDSGKIIVVNGATRDVIQEMKGDSNGRKK